MKKSVIVAAAAGMTLLSGCAITPYQGGVWYSNLSAPAAVTDNGATCSKVGESKSTNVLGLIGTGDASTAAAKKAAGITKVSNVDVEFTHILGLFNTTTTKVCGE